MDCDEGRGRRGRKGDLSAMRTRLKRMDEMGMGMRLRKQLQVKVHVQVRIGQCCLVTDNSGHSAGRGPRGPLSLMVSEQ